MNSSNDTQELAADLRKLIADAEKVLGDSVTKISSETRETLKKRLQCAQERFGDVCCNAKEKVTAGAKLTDKTIRENPYESLAVALGVGILVGVLAGRYTK